MQKTSTKDGRLIGVSGVHFVAGELSRLGYVVLVTTRNTKGFDLVVSDGKKSVHVQIKTRRTKNPWRLSFSDENNYGKNLFYVFVDISEEIPRFYVVESKFVSNYIKSHNHIWHEILRRKDGTRYKQTSIRVFPEKTPRLLKLSRFRNFDITKCENKWENLGLD